MVCYVELPIGKLSFLPSPEPHTTHCIYLSTLQSRHSSVSRSRVLVCSMIGPGFEPHGCLLTGVWKRTAKLPSLMPGVTPEMNIRKCVTRMHLPNMNKDAHSGIETKGYQWLYKKELCPPKMFLKKYQPVYAIDLSQ